MPFEPITRATTLPAPDTGLYRAVSATPPVVGSPGPRIVGLPETGDAAHSPREPHGTYQDARPMTKVGSTRDIANLQAYFSISCASALGTALVRFSSAPDDFNLSQSWGWKSSALRGEEYLSVPVPAEGDSTLGWVGQPEGGSLRATVVVGII